MLGVLELSVIGGVATLGIRQLRHRRTPNATKAVDMRSDAVALMTDVQALGNDLAHAVDDNYHRLMRTGRAKGTLIDLLRPDAWVPPSPKVQSALLYTEISPWKEHVLPIAADDDTQLLMQATAPDGKLGLSDAQLVARYVRSYWSPYAVVVVATRGA